MIEMRKGTIITIVTILATICLCILAGYIVVRPSEVDTLLKQGVLPRLISWSCLIVGSYGLARGRFSFIVTVMFFAISFFFAYIGVHTPFIKTFY